MTVKIHPHAKQRMVERGVSEEEIIATVLEGENFLAKQDRTGFRRNFSYEKKWLGKFYRTKQVEVFAVLEKSEWLVITVISRYF